MGVAYLEITPEILVEILKGLKAGIEPRFFQVVENGLPADTELGDIVVEDRFGAKTLELALESAEFEEGTRLLPPVLKTIYKGREFRVGDKVKVWQRGDVSERVFTIASLSAPSAQIYLTEKDGTRGVQIGALTSCLRLANE